MLYERDFPFKPRLTQSSRMFRPLKNLPMKLRGLSHDDYRSNHQQLSSHSAPSLEPARGKETHSTTEALLELTRAAHRTISSVETAATAITPAAASASFGLATALWNLDSGTSTTTPALDMAASAQPEAASGIENDVIKALAQALGVDDAA